MKIILAQIPESGLDVGLRPGQNKELDDWVKGLVSRSSEPEFELQFHLKPLVPPHYQMKGFFRLKVLEECARCGQDFEFWHQVEFREILTPFKDESYQEGVNHMPHEKETESWTYENGVFDVLAFLQSSWFLNWPMAWAPPINAQGQCEGCGDYVGFEDRVWESSGASQPLNNPFAKLRKH